MADTWEEGLRPYPGRSDQELPEVRVSAEGTTDDRDVKRPGQKSALIVVPVSKRRGRVKRQKATE